ncbi:MULTISPECIES: hypothetical protein [unclassified Nocardiopsis]|uniref:hypothetical protein n=1 Tax=unclassified Nocardiopsis TaxID=2649073 RepID=UPI001358EB48|nr:MULTISPECIES: hypothetical protein [unclassified Nocardiopsis]
MHVRPLALYGAGALCALLAATACGSVSASSSTRCSNGDCSVRINGTGGSGDLYESGRTEYEYEIRVEEDHSARVVVVEEVRDDETEQEAVLNPGESTQLFDYTVDYLGFGEDGASFEFTRGA